MATKAELAAEIEAVLGAPIDADKYTKEQLEAHLELLQQTQTGPERGLEVQVAQNLPMLRVRLAEGQVVAHPDDPYDSSSVKSYGTHEGAHSDELSVDGATAMVLVQGGAEILGTDKEATEAERARVQAMVESAAAEGGDE